MNWESFKWHYMNLNGRIGRGKFWLMYVLPMFVVGVIFEIVWAIYGTTAMQILIIPFIPILCALMCGYVKRQHDLGHSGWWVLIGFIPYVNFIYNLIYLGLFSGDEIENKYGLAPSERAA